MHTKFCFLSHDIVLVENEYHMRKSHAFETTGLIDSHTKSHAEYHPVPHRPSLRNPVNPIPTTVISGILAVQDSMGIPIPSCASTDVWWSYLPVDIKKFVAGC